MTKAARRWVRDGQVAEMEFRLRYPMSTSPRSGGLAEAGFFSDLDLARKVAQDTALADDVVVEIIDRDDEVVETVSPRG